MSPGIPGRASSEMGAAVKDGGGEQGQVSAPGGAHLGTGLWHMERIARYGPDFSGQPRLNS